MATTKIDNSSTGWAHTQGWSKRLHWFEEGRAHCSGSRSREGESLSAKPPAQLAEGEKICADCLEYTKAMANGGERSRRIRGIARVSGADRARRFAKGTSKLYREETAYA